MDHRSRQQGGQRADRPTALPALGTEPREPVGSDEARRLALELAAAGLEKKAVGIEIIDVCGKVDYTEFLVLMTGRGDRHVHAIARGVEEALGARGTVPLSVEGLTGSTWVLLDFNDVVVHVFQQQARSFYDLEGLWIDASRVELPEVDRQRRSEPPGERRGG